MLTNKYWKYFIGLFAVAGLLGIFLMTTPVQTAALNYFLSKNAAEWGANVHVNGASIALFPPEIELHELVASDSTGIFLSAASVNILPHRFWQHHDKWIIKRLDITQISGSIPTAWSSKLSGGEAASDVPFSCEIRQIGIEGLHLSLEEEWGSMGIEIPTAEIDSFMLGPAHFSAALRHAQLRLHPQELSAAWSSPMAFDSLHARVGIDEAKAFLQLQTQSNWGAIQGAFRRSETESTMDLNWNWTPKTWPLDTSVTWVELLKSRAPEHRLIAQFRGNENDEIAGQVEIGDWRIPAKWDSGKWSAGPFLLRPLATEWDVVWSQINCPRYIKESPLWQAEINGEDDEIALICSPLDNAIQIEKSIGLQWKPHEDLNDLHLTLKGLTFSENSESSWGRPWQVESDFLWDTEQGRSSFLLSDGEGSLLQGKAEAAWDSMGWSHTTQCSIEQLHSDLATREWDLFAQLSARGNETWEGNGMQIVELRDITLLENNVPRSFERFDLVQKQTDSEWEVTWESDLINGFARGNSQASDQWRLHPWTWPQPESPRSSASARGTTGSPRLEFATTVVRFNPIGLMADLPFTLGNMSTIQGLWDSQSIALQADLASLTYGGLKAQNLQLTWDIDGMDHAEVSCAIEQAILNKKPIGSSIGIRAVQSTAWSGQADWEQGAERAPGALSFELSSIPDGYGFTLDSLRIPFEGDYFTLQEPLHAKWSNTERELEAQSFRVESSLGYATMEGSYQLNGGIDVSTELNWRTFQGLSQMPDPWSAEGFSGELNISGNLSEPEIKGELQLQELGWKDLRASNITTQIAGSLRTPRVELSADIGPEGQINGDMVLSMDDPKKSKGRLTFEQIDLSPINQFIPDESIQLEGTVQGMLRFLGLGNGAELNGYMTTEQTALRVPFLNTRYTLSGKAQILPTEFLLNQWELTDESGQKARFNGTVLHDDFQQWDLDFGIDAQAMPIQLMNTPSTDDGFFFGEVNCTGDINIAGYGQNLTIDAELQTESGTVFSLPMDVSTDVASAQFVRFTSNTELAKPIIDRRGDFSEVQLNLGIDVTPDAEARIIFDRSVGDEIVGKAKGHLDLTVDDFEHLQLTGGLEVTEGVYYFTLQNWLSKRFHVAPGGTIVWEGDPYQAEIDLATSYATRARLDPLLPGVADLPGRIPVELGLQLTGALMRPSLSFDIQAPNADSRIQALMENALVNEEELQRQGLSLLVMNQFFSTDLSQAAIGGFLNPAQSTQLLANQLGHWISQISPGMDLGLDYDQDEFSGEQALGIAMSTQLFNDRLHIEGAVGAQSVGQIQPGDLQLQDLVISYDLSDEGTWQLTGHSRQNPGLSNAIEGTQTQGVGLRFRREFNRWGDWKRED